MPILAITTALLVIGGLLLLSKAFGNVSPNKNRIQEDLAAMRKDVASFAQNLVPITVEELDAFSKAQINQSVKKGVATTAKGIFTSIFDEPLVAYSYKRYARSGKGGHALLYARTANHEIAYRISDEGVTIIFDQQIVGTLMEDGGLYSAKTRKVIAQVSEGEKNMLSVKVNNREVGSVVKSLPAPNQEGLSLRAFQFVRNDLAEDEKKLLLSVAVLELVNQHLPA